MFTRTHAAVTGCWSARGMVDPSPFRHADADASPGFLLWKLTSLWQRALGEVLDGFGITQTQYAILASLRWFEGQGTIATQTDLAEHARLERMTLSKAIRKLEAEGLVSRAPSAVDGRATAVRFSAKGRRLTERAIVAIEETDDVFFGTLSVPHQKSWKALVLGLIAGNSQASTVVVAFAH